MSDLMLIGKDLAQQTVRGNAVPIPTDVYADLVTEGDALDRIVAGLEPAQWSMPTPAPGWTIAHQVAHLASVARLAMAAAAAPEVFKEQASKATGDFDSAVNAMLQPYLASAPEQLLARWRGDRTAASDALSALPPSQMVPWLVRPIPAGVLAAAGFMELFAHGQDIADAVGVRREYTDRIWHLTSFAVHTWDFGYLARGLKAPDTEFRFEFTSPSGERWEFGPPDSPQRVAGPALDFCMLVTRRRHRDDLALVATGDEADYWMGIAQCYRGSPGEGRSPGQFAASSKR